MQLPRMLHAKVLGSPYAHARIVSIDTSKARTHPGVEAVFTAADLPEYKKNPSNRRGLIFPDEEVLFHGQPVAAVLASDPHVAEDALSLIRVAYEALPPVVDPIAAMNDDSPLVRSPLGNVDRSEERGHVTVAVEQEEAEGKQSNIASQMNFKRGDTEAGFAEADVVVENTWRSAVVHQSYIEPHSTIADYDNSGELSVWTSSQAPFYVRDELAQTLGLPENKIRVTATEVGGGFGGKIYLQELMVAALAMALRRPVKYIMSRKEDMLAATPAPQAIIDLKTGMKRDGTLTALKSRVVYDSGAFPGAPMLPGCLLIGGYYKCENLEINGFEVLTNKVSVGALRAPGAHNVTFAIESHMDVMARELGLDPIEVRLKNAVEEGDPLPSGQPYPRIGLQQCLEAIAESEVWKRRSKEQGAGSQNGRKRGIGLAIGGWLGGLQPASAIVCLNSDGTINVTVGSADITGTNTSFAQIAAEVLNVPLEMVNVTTGDTRTAPYAGMSAGSKTTYTVGRAVKLAAEDARHQMLEIAAKRFEAAPEELEMADGVVRLNGSEEKTLTFQRLGRLSTNFVCTWLDKLYTDTGVLDDAGDKVAFDCKGLYGSICGTPNPEWRHQMRVGLEHPSGVGVTARWRYFGSVEQDTSSSNPALNGGVQPANAKIPSVNYFDLTLTYETGDHYKFRLGANNVFDKEPPVVGSPACPAGPCNGNTFSQVYDALGRYIFAGVTLDF